MADDTPDIMKNFPNATVDLRKAVEKLNETQQETNGLLRELIEAIKSKAP